MEDLLIHGDSVYDIIDKQDHAQMQSELNSKSSESKRILLCRMNVSRNSRRQMRFGDQKVVLMEGRFSGSLPLCSRNDPVFVSWCTPIAMPETRESMVAGATNIVCATLDLDFTIRSIDNNADFYLGYKKSEMVGASFYHLLHPESVRELQAKHRVLTHSETEKACILLVRLQSSDGCTLWSHTVVQVKESALDSDKSSSAHIVCTNQILNKDEAEVLRRNAWLYHYYMVQTRLQYNLAYGGTAAVHTNALANNYNGYEHHYYNENVYPMYNNGYNLARPMERSRVASDDESEGNHESEENNNAVITNKDHCKEFLFFPSPEENCWNCLMCDV